MDTSVLQIRNFEIGDRALVEAFFDQMGGETRAFFDRGRGNRNNALGYFEGKDRNALRWLALDQGRMVGYVFLWELDNSVPWLGIAVAEEYKGKQLGRSLMQIAQEYAIAQGKGGILLTTHIANLRGQALYEKCGYERMGIHTSGEILYMLRFESLEKNNTSV
jgi:ribosomal protein S18 acetylase RimI-like enzyme